MYPQLGNLSSRRSVVGGCASWGNCQLGDVPVGGPKPVGFPGHNLRVGLRVLERFSPTGTPLNWHIFKLALPPIGTFWIFFCAIKNLSPPTAGTAKISNREAKFPLIATVDIIGRGQNIILALINYFYTIISTGSSWFGSWKIRRFFARL